MGYLRAVQFLMWHSFAPIFLTASPPQIWDILGGERYIFLMLLLPRLVFFGVCWGTPQLFGIGFSSIKG